MDTYAAFKTFFRQQCFFRVVFVFLRLFLKLGFLRDGCVLMLVPKKLPFENFGKSRPKGLDFPKFPNYSYHQRLPMVNLKSISRPCNGAWDKQARRRPMPFNFDGGQTFFFGLSVADLRSRLKSLPRSLLYLRGGQKVNRGSTYRYSNVSSGISPVHFVATGNISEVGNDSVINEL